MTPRYIPCIKTNQILRLKKSGTDAFIPHDILKSPRLVSLAARIKMTPAQQAASTKTFIEEAGGDVSKVSTSYQVADRSRRAVCEVDKFIINV